MNESGRPLWTTNKAPTADTQKSSGDLTLSGYRGLRGKIMQWGGRAVQVVIHQKGQSDVMEYLDRVSLTATYLRLSRIAGVSDNDQIVAKLSEDREVQKFVLQSLAEYKNGRIEIDKLGSTKDLHFAYSKFADLVNKKMSHIKDEGVIDKFLHLFRRRKESQPVSRSSDPIGEFYPDYIKFPGFREAVDQALGADREAGLQRLKESPEQRAGLAMKILRVLMNPPDQTQEVRPKQVAATTQINESEDVEMSDHDLYKKMETIFGYWMELPGFKESVAASIRNENEPFEAEINHILDQLKTGERNPQSFILPALSRIGTEKVIGWIIERKQRLAAEVEREISDYTLPIAPQEITSEQNIDLNRVRLVVDEQKVDIALFAKEVENLSEKVGVDVIDQRMNLAWTLAGAQEDKMPKQLLTDGFSAKGFDLLWREPIIELAMNDREIVIVVTNKAKIMDKNALGNAEAIDQSVLIGFKRTERISLDTGAILRTIEWERSLEEVL